MTDFRRHPVQRFRAWLDKSISHRISAATTALTLGFVLLVGTANFSYVLQVTREAAHKQLDDAASEVGTHIANALNHLVDDSRSLARNPTVVSSVLDSSGQDIYLQPLLSRYYAKGNEPRTLCVTNYKGAAIGCARPPLTSYAGDSGVRATIEGNRTSARLVSRDQRQVLVIASPVLFEGTASAEGAVVAEYELTTLLAAVAGPTERYAYLHLNGKDINEILLAGNSKHNVGVTYRLLVDPLLEPLGLSIDVGLPEAVVNAPVRRLVAIYVGLALLLLPLAYFSSRLLARALTRRVTALADEARRVATVGPISTMPPSEHFGRDEIGDLAATVAELLGELKAKEENLEILVARRTDELAAREADLNRAQSIARIGSWTLDLEHNVLHWSAEAHRIFGVAEGTPLDFDFFLDRVHPDDRAAVEAAWAEALDGAGYDIEHRIFNGGEIYWVREAAELEFASDGSLRSAIGTVQDITERRIAEEQLRQLSAAVEQSPASIVITNPRGEITYVNPQFERITGYSAAEVIGRTSRILKSGRMLPFEYGALWTTITAGRVWRGEFENRRKDGSLFWELASISPIVTPEGVISGYVGVKEDVTFRKQAEREIREREAKLSALLSSLPDILLVIDGDGRISEFHCHDASLALRPDAFVDRPFIEALPAELAERLDQTLAGIVADGQARKLEYTLDLPVGRRHFSAAITRLDSDEAEAAGFIVLARDVTDRKQAEAALIDSEAYNKALFESSHIPLVIMVPESGQFIDCNRAAVAIYGLTDRVDVLGRTPLDMSAPTQYDGTASAEAVRQHVATALEQGTMVFEWRHRRPDGELWDAEVRLMSFRHHDRTLLQFSLQDITARKQAEARMREAMVVFNASSQGIMTTDADGAITAVNPAFCAITGYPAEEVVGHKSSMFKSGRHDAAFFAAMWKTLAETDRWEGEIWNRRKSGEIYPQWLGISAVRDERGAIVEYVSLFSDITQRKQQEEAIWRQANFDALTGLANRSLLHDRLERALAQARRSDRKVGLMFIDLDGFKWINDTLGHDVGDELLVEVAHRLTGCVRDQDTVARLGGDEFTLVVHELSDTDNLLAIGEKVVGVLRNPFAIGGSMHHLSGSVGITVFPDDGEDVQTLLKNADIAMYKSKQAGKNRFQFYARHMQADALERIRIEADLRVAIETQAFVLHYQPIVDADSGELIGAEALIRWQHPQRGLISPLEFIPVAEDSGLIVAIGEWALREAARQWQCWHEQGHPALRLAVNVSGVQFREADLPALINRILDEFHVDHGSLMLEITESVLMDGSEAAEAHMREIKAQGIGYSLDDFGTGFSSLSYLKRFPVDIVKIDRSFVNDCPDDRNDAHLVEAIINMAHSLDLRVTAEGVETEAQLAFLRDLGCDYLQGYLISKPVPAAEFEALIVRHLLLPTADGASLEENRLLAALRQDELDVDDWLRRLLGERSPDLADYLAGQDWVDQGLDLKQAIDSHLSWRQRLNDYVGGRRTADPMAAEDAGSVSQCRLGAWIIAHGDGGNPRLVHLDRVHREFHKLAGQIVDDFNLGHRDSARRTLASLRFRTASRNVVVALIDCFQKAAATAP